MPLQNAGQLRPAALQRSYLFSKTERLVFTRLKALKRYIWCLV